MKKMPMVSTHTHTHTNVAFLSVLDFEKSVLGEASNANAISGSDKLVIQGEEGIICTFIWFIPLDVF